MDERISLIHDCLEPAGKIYLKYLHDASGMVVEEKKTNDFVTIADKEIESFLSEQILAKFPQDSILREEYEDIRGSSGFSWVIDPIDGTNNYARLIPDARIQIALVENGEITYGAIYNPNTNELFSARRGMGAFKTNISTNESIRLSVSNRPASQSLVILTVALATSENTINTILKALQDKIGTVRIYGCAAIAFELIAEGKADAFITNIAKPMDMAPGAVIVEEAGGKAMNFDGSNWSLVSSQIIVTNTLNSSDLLRVIQI